MGLFGMPPGFVAGLVVTVIVLTVVFGAIFGAIYSKLCDSIPGEGVMKGLYFGLMIWLIHDISQSAFLAFVDKEITLAISTVFAGFFIWIVYGLVIGKLYKK